MATKRKSKYLAEVFERHTHFLTRDVLGWQGMAATVAAEPGGVSGLDFSGRDISHMRFHGRFSRCRFDGCKADGAVFGFGNPFADEPFVAVDCSFRGMYGSGASMRDAKLIGCALEEMRMEGLLASDAFLHGCRLDGSVFLYGKMDRMVAVGVGLSGCALIGVSLKEADLHNASAFGSEWAGCDLELARLDGMDIRHARFAGCAGLDGYEAEGMFADAETSVNGERPAELHGDPMFDGARFQRHRLEELMEKLSALPPTPKAILVPHREGPPFRNASASAKLFDEGWRWPLGEEDGEF